MNILKNIVRVGLIVTALSFNLVSCDYLDVVPPEQAGLQDATKTRKSTLGFLFTCYAGLQEDDSPIGHTSALNGSTDEFALPIEWRNDSGAFWDDYAYNLVSAANPDGLWGNYYKYIGQCYLFLRQVENNPGETLLQEWLPGEKEQWLAEAHFLIAYYHFALLRKYGPIPVVTEYVPQSTPSSDFGGRYHYDYCVNWIAYQLDLAAQNLPPTREGTEWGRATSTMAKALKARVLMYAASPLWNGSFVYPNWRNTNYETPGYGMELVSNKYDPAKWERALTACKEALTAAEAAGYKLFDLEASEAKAAIDKVPLPFIPGKEEDTEENELFKKQVRMLQYMITAHEGFSNKEIIWAINPQYGDGNDANDVGCGRSKSRLPNRLVKKSDGSWAGGYHGTAPTWAAVNRFYTENGLPPAKDPDFYLQSEWLTRYYEGASSPELSKDQLDSEEIKNDIVKFNVGREPRYYAWIAYDGCEYMPLINNNNPLWLNLKNSNTNGYSLSNTRNATGTGFLNKKFIVPNGVYLSSGSTSGDKFRIILIRMAELYLNLAECYAALDRTDEALENLNVIRERAGVRKLTTADLSTMSLMEWVRNERAIELHAEGHRYYDVRRWRIADQVMQPSEFKGLNGMTVNPSFEEFNQIVPIDQPIQWNVRQYLVPIKNSELYSDPQLVQAPGY